MSDTPTSAAVRLVYMGWREYGDDGHGGEAHRRFQFIGEFEGDPPAWPVGWVLDGAFTLARLDLSSEAPSPQSEAKPSAGQGGDNASDV